MNSFLFIDTGLFSIQKWLLQLFWRVGCCLLAIVALCGLPCSALGETMLIDAPFSTPAVGRDAQDVTRFDWRGLACLSAPGAAEVPWRRVRVLLPPNADPASLRVRLKNESWEELGVHVPHIVPAPLSWDVERGRRLAARTAERNPQRPHEVAPVCSVGRKGPWLLLDAYVPLFQWSVGAGETRESCNLRELRELRELRALRSATLRIDFDVEGDRRGPRFAPRPEFELSAQEALNYASMAPRYASRFRTDGHAGRGYAIVTTAAVVGGSANLAAFVQHKEDMGFSVTMATESDWGGGTGDTAAGNIKAWLTANADALGLQYVLLIGDPEQNAGDVPMKGLTPRPLEDQNQNSTSDIWYTDLTGDWDLDDDGLVAEYGSYPYYRDFDYGGVDLHYELAVGRLPHYGDMTATDAILASWIAYEQVRRVQAGWRRMALLPMNPLDSNTPGWRLGQAIWNDFIQTTSFAGHRIYDPDDEPDYPTPETSPCSLATTTAQWTAEHPGYVAWFCHGSSTQAQDVLDIASLSSLPNGAPSVVFAGACSNGDPDDANNLAYQLLKSGAAAVVASTRYSWYYPGKDHFANQADLAGLVYEFSGRIVRENLPLGRALCDMREEVRPNSSSYWMNFVNFNLYGDPSMRLMPLPDFQPAMLQLLMTP